MAADRLALGQQRCDRLAKGPGELAVGTWLALIDLRASAWTLSTTRSSGAAMASGRASAANTDVLVSAKIASARLLSDAMMCP
ncbi:hypothetical protein ACVWYH_007495 [Bradyrhizobium sp. GM24.11]